MGLLVLCIKLIKKVIKYKKFVPLENIYDLCYYCLINMIRGMWNIFVSVVRKNWSYLVGFVVGGLVGYLYWYFIGCASGTCAIASSPIYSFLWGALMGALLLNLFVGIIKK